MAKNNEVVREACKHQGENYEWTTKHFGVGCIPWCACFIWSILDVCKCLYAIGNVKGTFVHQYENAMVKLGCKKITNLKDVKEGDIVLITWDKKDADHIGFIRANGYSDKEIQTIEGNTTRIAGHDEGSAKNIVSKKTRKASEVWAIYRPKYTKPKKKDYTEYEIVKGDTLWEISKRFYNDPYKYTKIMTDNKIKDSHSLEIGQVIKIYKE